MKDYYDIWLLSEQFSFDGETLKAAIIATFKRRQTALPPEAPVGLSNEFMSDPGKRAQWQAFVLRGRLDSKELSLEKVVERVAAFVMPPSNAAAERSSFGLRWAKGGPWEPVASLISCSLRPYRLVHCFQERDDLTFAEFAFRIQASRLIVTPRPVLFNGGIFRMATPGFSILWRSSRFLGRTQVRLISTFCQVQLWIIAACFEIEITGCNKCLHQITDFGAVMPEGST